MFKFKPYLMFNGTPAEGGGETTPPAPSAEETPPAEDLGFPANTPLADMTVEQQAAYWRNQSKVQQKEAEAYRRLGLTPEQIRQMTADAETARLAALSEQERAVEEARKAGKAEGIAAGAETYLTDAIEGRVVAMTMQPGESYDAAVERVRGALAFADLRKFVGEDGALDATKIQTFAESFGQKNAGDAQHHGSDLLLHDVLTRQQQQAPSSGSVDAYATAAYDRLSKKK